MTVTSAATPHGQTEDSQDRAELMRADGACGKPKIVADIDQTSL
jgi:hypothetical protein